MRDEDAADAVRPAGVEGATVSGPVESARVVADLCIQYGSATVSSEPRETIAHPFMKYTEFSPVEELRHRMSALPSPSKSPIPFSSQKEDGSTMLTRPRAAIVHPFIK